MSYDFYLTSHCKACDTDHHHFNKNYTSNVAPMFAHRFKDGIGVINNQDAVYGGQILFDLLEHFLDNKEELEKLNPKNGWSNYEDVLKFIRGMVKASMKAPNDAVWTVYSWKILVNYTTTT